MEASIVDLRYRMKNIMNALNRNEHITVLYHGQKKAVITPISKKTEKSVMDHKFFGMNADCKKTVEETMEQLRGRRY